MPIDQNTFDSLFLIMMTVIIGSLLWIPPAWLLLSIFTPKKLLTAYFKEPHFSRAETILMASFPGFLMRTVIFGWLVLIPALDRKRKIKGAIAIMPAWYRIALRVFILGNMISLVVIVGIMLFLLAMIYITEPVAS